MSFESPDNEKNFPGLYRAGSVGDQTSVTEEDHDKQSKKKELGKKKDGKRDKKEKGYMMFEEEDSEDDLTSLDDIKSPSKVKKGKAGFKFPARKDIFVKKEKDEKKEKEARKEEKEKKKEEKEGKKHKLKEKKKPKHGHLEVPTVIVPSVYEKPIFGVPLSLSVERNRSHDGIELPAIFRECIDHIEEYGLACEGIYRISGVKSKVQTLKDCYNKGIPAYLEEHEPNVVASLLKQFLRDLPEPVLTSTLMPKFEEASTIKNERKRVEQFRKLIDELPVCNRLLLSWMIVHMTHIIERQKENKMSLQNVSIVLSPTMQISHRVLNIFFTYAHQLFTDTILKKYVPPLKPATSRWSLELPDSPAALEEELAKQESLLNQLHAELNAGIKDHEKEEQLWEVQRVVTQLKRKIKFAKKAVEAAEKRRKDLEQKKSSTHFSEEEDLHLDLREMPRQKKESVVPKKEAQKKEPPAKKKETPEEKVEKKSEEEKKEVKVEIEAENQNEASKSENEVETEKTDQSEQEDSKEDVKTQEVEKSVTEPEKQKVESSEEGKAETDEAEAPEVEIKEEKMKEEKMKEEKVKEEKIKEVKIKEEKIKEDKEDVENLKQEVMPQEKVKQEVKKSLKAPAGHREEGLLVHPHIHLSNELLQPIKVEASVTPKKDETNEELFKHSEELRELEEELLGEKKPEKRKVKFDEKVKEEKKNDVKERRSEGDMEHGVMEVEVHVDGGEDVLEPIYDEELQQLLEDEDAMKMEEEELLAISDELRQKIETEQSEIERLHQEIQELQYLRQDSDLEDMSSSSDSSYESEDEEELQDILTQLIQENEELEKKNAELCQKIHEERMICLSVKLQIRLLQQKQLETSQGSNSGMDRETFL